MKKSVLRFSSILILLLLLWNPPLAYRGARDGLLLWADVVLPTLLPFMLCSNAIVAIDAIHILTFPFQYLLTYSFRLSKTGSYVLVSGLLCGYPMGAKTCREFVDSGKITSKEGAYLLSICNHPSPMFLLGFAAPKLFGIIPVWLLLVCVYLPILPVAMLSRFFYGIDKPQKSLPYSKEQELSFDESLMNSFDVMVKIGGYIMLFSIVASYIRLLPIKNLVLRSLLLGFIEITTGIQAISGDTAGIMSALLITGVTAFGGMSGIFQTKSVISGSCNLKNAGLSIRHYVAWKAVHTVLSCILFILLTYFLPALQ